MESDQRVTAEDLSSRWTAIQQKLTEEIRPETLRRALCNPWLAAALGIAAGTAVGYLLARRSARQPQRAPERLPAASDRPKQSPHSPGLVSLLAVSALEQGTRTLLARMPRDPCAKLTKACH